ncbi:hypothetical protein ACVBEQ_11135 [Nakamurella sp. GG22]
MLDLLRDNSLVSYNGRFSGLGNRIRVVLGSKMLAQAESRAFYYVWPTGRTFGPRFSQLWEITDRTLPRAVSKALSFKYPYLDHTLDWLDDRRRADRIWQIRTSHALHLPAGTRSWHEELRSMRPVGQVVDRIKDSYDGGLAQRPYVGVMIRAHAASHTKTIEHSPVEWYLDRMREIRAGDPDVQFFVSSDVAEVQNRVGREIGGCHSLSDKGAYNSVQGVRSAVADLYLLASSSYLLGPHYSSFVELARYLAGEAIPLETSMAAPTGEYSLAAAGQVSDPTRPHLREHGASPPTSTSGGGTTPS